MSRGWRWLAVAGMLVSPLAAAHPLAPALLDLRETAPGLYAVTWRTSVSRAGGVDVAPQFPDGCAVAATGTPQFEPGEALAQTFRVDCGGAGLGGRRIAVAGLDRSRINVIVRVTGLNAAPVQGLLDAQQPDFTVDAPGASSSVFGSYGVLGIEHLFTGFDHMLFVAGLVLLIRRLRPLVATITAFTVGHSVTLSLATFGFVHVNSALMEFGIALSILVLAVELARPPGRPSLLARRPWAMAGAFGLLHGLGFAGALADIGLPEGEIPRALLGFNVGIELGQLGLVAGLLAAAQALRRLPRPATPIHARALPVYVIGALAAFWCFERAAPWWS